MNPRRILEAALTADHLNRLLAIDNPAVHEFIATYIELCQPEDVFVCTDSPDDLAQQRADALKYGEERQLKIPGQTLHFDGYYDQARDKEHTKYLVPKGMNLGAGLNAIDKDTGVAEVLEIMKGIMKGHRMYVRFFCLGPTGSVFSIPSLQLTDSAYVSHSLDLLYRQGYEEFRRLGRNARFFKVVHSEGELENHVSKNIKDRRVYIDTFDNIVYSVNTQYGGNSLGLKKLSMRLAINRASQEGWLCEHMFLMGVHGPQDRITYFTGAFPSMCGKTSTSMIAGESIVGDDISYLRVIDGKVRAVNVERGMFGIIMGINAVDDPIIWDKLHSPNEIIFSNVLLTEDNHVYWIDKSGPEHTKGINHSGEWVKGKVDAEGKEIPPSHKNARFTLKLEILDNVDPKLHDPQGCPVGGIIYGGRDSESWVPVAEAFDWVHGMITFAASLESETTAATLGKEGVRAFSPMSNLDFLSIPIGRYIQDNLNFGALSPNPPPIFGVNYFLRDLEKNFLNEKTDKAVWLKWMELRSHSEIGAIPTPIGLIPHYKDLQNLFRSVLKKNYTHEDYLKQFSIRVPKLMDKINRIVAIYRTQVPDAPPILFQVLEAQQNRLAAARERFGDIIPPEQFLRP